MSEGLKPKTDPDLITDTQIIQGNRNEPNPFTKMFIRTSQQVTVTRGIKGNRFTLAISYEEAYDIFEQVIKLDPLHEESFILLHRAKTKLGIVEIEQDSNKDTTRTALQYQQDLFKEGLTAFTNSDFTRAKRTLNRLHNLNPRYPHLKSYLRKVDKEISRLKKDKDASTRIEYLFKTGSDHYVNGNILQARTYLDSVLLFDSNHKEALSLLLKINEDILKQQAVQFRQGIMLYSQGSYRKAIHIWKEALAIDSTNTIINNYISEADTQLKEIKKMHRTEAKRYLSERKLKRVIDEYEQILRYFPDDTEIGRKKTTKKLVIYDKTPPVISLEQMNEYVTTNTVMITGECFDEYGKIVEIKPDNNVIKCIQKKTDFSHSVSLPAWIKLKMQQTRHCI